MRTDRYMGIFSLTEPWSSLGILRRVARVCRILFGVVLFSSIVGVAVFVCCVSFSDSVRQGLSCLVLMPVFALFAWAVGCMFIWRPVYPAPPLSRGSPPMSEDAELTDPYDI